MKNSKMVKITSAILATVIVGTTFFAYFRVPAGASTSLNHIESIKASKQNGNLPFNIVEIAPSAEYGTMGYYVKGQEPSMVKNWLSVVSKMKEASERESYANEVVFGPLVSKGLASETDQTPLTITGTYEEHYPWESDFYSDAENKQYYLRTTQLNTVDVESFSAKGTPVPYTVEDEENNVPKKGYDYDMDYNYVLFTQSSLFDFKTWYETSKGSWNNDDEFHNMTHTGSSSFTPTEETYLNDNTLTIDMTKDTATFDDESYIKLKGDGSDYIIALSQDESYTFYYKTDFTRIEKSESEYYDIKSKIKLFVSGDGQNFTQLKDSEDQDVVLEDTSYGNHSFTFTTDSEKRYLKLQFGAEGYGKVAISGIQLYKNTEADYIQHIDKFVYGDAEDSYSDNLFDLNHWYDNAHSQNLVNKTSDDTLTFDRENRTVIIENDNAGANEVYTSFIAPDAYFINADPGATYVLEYKVKVLSGDGVAKTRVATFKTALTAFSTLTPEGGTATSSEPYVVSTGNNQTEKLTFTTDSDSKYIKLSFGVSDKNTVVSYSNIRIRKVIET